jgi:hypothetical protein
LQAELAKEKAAREMAWIAANKFAVKIPSLEEKIKHLENRVTGGLNKVRAKELSLECTTTTNEDYKKNSQLTKKLESKSL